MKPVMLTAAAVAASLLLTACSDDDKTVYVDKYQEIEIPFTAVAGSTAIDCDADLTNLGTNNSSGKIADFRFFVHNVRLVLDSGAEVAVQLNETAMQTANIAMLDFRNRLPDAGNTPCAGDDNPNMNTRLVGRYVLGDGVTAEVVGLAFTLGVPFSHNHASQTNADGPLKNPGIASGMAWSWQVGYKFTGLDLLTDELIVKADESTATRWNIHVGSTGCSVSTTDLESGIEPVPCEYPNRSDIVLDGFSFNKAVQLDYAELVADSNLNEDQGGAVGCMSGPTDPECESLFAKLGLVHALSGGDPAHPPTQTAFSLVDLNDSGSTVTPPVVVAAH